MIHKSARGRFEKLPQRYGKSSAAIYSDLLQFFSFSHEAFSDDCHRAAVNPSPIVDGKLCPVGVLLFAFKRLAEFTLFLILCLVQPCASVKVHMPVLFFPDSCALTPQIMCKLPRHFPHNCVEFSRHTPASVFHSQRIEFL